MIAHGLQGDVNFAASLAKALPADQPVYGFSAPGLDGREPPLTDIADYAKRFLADAQAAIGAGPIRLAGFCGGSYIALEMAHRLAERGIATDHLYLIDCPRGLSTAEFDMLADKQVDIARRRLETHPEVARYLSGAPETVRAYTDALRFPPLRPYRGRTSLFVSREILFGVLDPDVGWTPHLPANTRIRVFGETREDLLKAGISGMAAVIAMDEVAMLDAP